VRLLLVEDEPLTVRMLAKGLREQAAPWTSRAAAVRRSRSPATPITI
jgi:hypothetical protein